MTTEQRRIVSAKNVESVAWVSLAVLSLVYVAAFLVVAAQRFRYPFELEWLEPTVLGHISRILSASTVYPPPSESFVPFLYPPLYYYLSAPFEALFGSSFWPLRALSVVSTLVTFGVLYAIVLRETSSRVAGVLGASLYASCYALTNFWFDLARVDSLFIALTVSALYWLRFSETRRHFCYAALLIAAAGLTKQTALVVLLPVATVVLAVRRDMAFLAVFSGVFVFAFGLPTLLLDTTSNGWYRFWIFELGSEHAVEPTAYSRFFSSDLRPFALVIGLCFVAAYVLTRRRNWTPLGFWILATITAGVAALTSRLHTGGAENVLLPLYAVIAIDGGIAIGTLLRAHAAWRLLTFAVVTLQLLLLTYDPRVAVPTAADEVTGQRFISWLRSIPGDVLVISHPSYAVMAGKQWHAGQPAIIDVVRAENDTAKRELRDSLALAVREQRYAAIVLDIPGDAIALPPDLDNYYQPSAVPVYDNDEDFYPVSSLRTRPNIVYTRRTSGAL